MSKTYTVSVARVYDKSLPAGCRVLVDRIWPRGVAKAAARWDMWLPALAPTTDLRRWYGHDPARHAEFESRYCAELADDPHRAAIADLRERAGGGQIVLLTATKDLELSHARTLAGYLNGM